MVGDDDDDDDNGTNGGVEKVSNSRQLPPSTRNEGGRLSSR